MNFKRTGLWIGLAGLAVVGLLVFAMTRPDDDTVSGERIFPGLAGTKIDEIDSVELIRTQPKDEKIVFTRNPQTKQWSCTTPYPTKVDPQSIDALAQSIINLKPVAYPETPSDPEKVGLGKPTIIVTIRQGSTKTATLNIGQITIGGEKAVAFAATSASPSKIFAVKKSELAALWKDPLKAEGDAFANAKSLADFRAKRLFGNGLRDLQLDIRTLRVKSKTKELKLESDDAGGWKFIDPATFGDADPAGATTLNQDVFTGVNPLLNTLSMLAIAGSADVIESPSKDDLKKYGLEGDDALRIELTDKQGRTDAVYIGKSVDDNDPMKKRYIRSDGDASVLIVSVDKFDALLRTVADPTMMRNRDVIPSSWMTSIDGVDFAVNGQTIKLRKYGKNEIQKWYIVGGKNDPMEANIAKLDQFLLAISRPRLAVDFPVKSDETAYTGENLKATITLWRNGMISAVVLPEAGKPTPEPVLSETAKSTVLTIGKSIEKNLSLKKLDDKRTTEFLIADAILPLLPKSRIDLLAPAVPSYPTNKVSRLMLERPSGPIDVTKDPKPDPMYPLGKWTFQGPADRKGKVADQPKADALLALVSPIKAMVVVAESPSDAELQVFGLKSPLKVVVELSDEPGKQRTYEFGNETTDRNFVYARYGASPLVFTVPKADADRFKSEDLRDSILYRIERAKLNGVTMRGWATKMPAPPTHEYGREGNEWKCKAPAGAILDTQKLAALMSHIEQPRAVKFLGPVKPEYKLDLASGAIEITLKQDGVDPIVLTLGAEMDGGMTFAATVSTLPGEVVTIPATALKVFASSPDGVLVKQITVPPPVEVKPEVKPEAKPK